ncbi:MAG: RNA polymerase sigma factor [Planctomycetia bacterium]|nr:RNA polymerase sigma factor [Planctomycetia bacterium]
MHGTRFSPILHYLRRLVGPSCGGQTDTELLERFIGQRDEAAFEALVQRHGPLVWGVCRRSLADPHAAEDAFQATFLVLARRAEAIVQRASVRSWLYGVACRIARRARERDRRERARMTVLDPVQLAAPSDADAWRQLQPILDEELDRLPEKYRAPLLLCYLDGKTRDEAAQELGWTEGAVKGRLERGRELLRNRLSRRGLPLSAALLTALPAEGSAAPPAALTAAAAQAVLGGGASTTVTALSEGVIQAMLWTKWSMTTTLALGLGLFVGGAGTATWYALGRASAAATAPGAAGAPAEAAPHAFKEPMNAIQRVVAEADLAFIGKVVQADLTERPLPGFIGVLQAPVEYAVTRKLRGNLGQRSTVQVPLRGADLREMPPNYLDAAANRLNAELFAVDNVHLVCVKKNAVFALFPASKDVLDDLTAAPNPAAELDDQQLAALALETARKGKFVELQEIASRNQHLGGQRLLEQPFRQQRLWCVVQAHTPAAPVRAFLAASRDGKTIYPFKAEDFAKLYQAEDRSKWTEREYRQAAELYIHLTGTPHQDGWKVLDSAEDFMAIKFNMFPQNEAKRAAAAKSIEKPKVTKEGDRVQVRLWAWHLIGGALKEWTIEFTPTDVKASSKDHGRFGGGGYD